MLIVPGLFKASFFYSLVFMVWFVKRLHKHLQAISCPCGVRVIFCNYSWRWVFLHRHHHFVIIRNLLYIVTKTRSLRHVDRSHSRVFMWDYWLNQGSGKVQLYCSNLKHKVHKKFFFLTLVYLNPRSVTEPQWLYSHHYILVLKWKQSPSIS